MRLSRIKLENWRNFREIEVSDLPSIVYILGANGTGKSSLLDAIRFLGDLAKPVGGGLQAATLDRGLPPKIRFKGAPKGAKVAVEVDISNEHGKYMTYRIAFTEAIHGSKGLFDPLTIWAPIAEEKLEIFPQGGKSKTPEVWKFQIDRGPNSNGNDQFGHTRLQQFESFPEFREAARFFSEIRFHHLIPGLVRKQYECTELSGAEDPHGATFLETIGQASEADREQRFSKISDVARFACPNLSLVEFDDGVEPRLKTFFRNEKSGRDWAIFEDDLSDGTLRLFGMIWQLLGPEKSPLLLEEPETSLNDEVVAAIPEMLHHFTDAGTDSPRKQVFATTHSYALLSNQGIDPDGIVVLEVQGADTIARKPNEPELAALSAGFSPGEVMLPNIRRTGGFPASWEQ